MYLLIIYKHIMRDDINTWHYGCDMFFILFSGLSTWVVDLDVLSMLLKRDRMKYWLLI